MDLKNKPVVSVIFSFRNEERVLEPLIRRTQAVFETTSFDYELIFANDASTDRSLEILKNFHQKDPRIKILNMTRRFGVSNCFMAGFDQASGDAVIMMDSDLQDPPELIPQLLAKWQEGSEIVHTVRSKRKGESWAKVAITALGYRIWKWLIPNLLIDSGDYRLLSRRAAKEIVKLRQPDLFFRAVTRNLECKQDWVPYERDKRYAGETHFSLLNSLSPFKMFLAAILFNSHFFKVFSKTAIKKELYVLESQYGFE